MMGPRAGFDSALILAACAVILPPLALWAPLALAPLLAVAAIAILVRDGRAALAAARGLAPLALLLAALAAWATLSASWSILPLHSLLEGLRLGAISAAGLVVLGAALALAPAERSHVGIGAMIGVGAAVVLMLVERATGDAVTHLIRGGTSTSLLGFDRGATTLALALWPASIAAAQRRWVERLALALVVAAAVFAMASSAAALAIVVGCVVLAIARVAPRLVAIVLAAGLVLVAVALPLAMPDFRAIVALHQDARWIKFSGIHRLLIWRFTADRIAERPMLGWGMDASRALPGGKTDLTTLLPQAGLTPDSEALPLHPHNAALQWRVELGVPATLAALAVVGWGLWRIGFGAALAPFARAGALAWAAAALVIALLAYGAWQAWWLSCLWLTASLFAAVTPAAGETRRDSGDIPARDRL